MLTTWARYFFGLPMQKYEAEFVENTRVELGIHNTMWMVQLGSVFGVGVLGPLLATSQPGLSRASVVRYAGKCGRLAALTGLAVGPFVSYISNRYRTQQELLYACNQVRMNRSELLINRSSVVGLVAGYSIGKYIGYRAGNAAAFGIVGGLIIGEVVTSLVHTPVAQQHIQI